MLELLKNEVFWVMAIGINFIFTFIKPFIKKYAHAISEEEKVRQHIYWFIILIISGITTYLVPRIDNLPLIDNSYILTSIWLAFTSIFIYSVGIDFIFSVIKERLKK